MQGGVTQVRPSRPGSSVAGMVFISEVIEPRRPRDAGVTQLQGQRVDGKEKQSQIRGRSTTKQRQAIPCRETGSKHVRNHLVRVVSTLSNTVDCTEAYGFGDLNMTHRTHQFACME